MRGPSSRAGQNLVELVIVAVIVAVGLFPLLSAFSSYFRGMHRDTRRTSATLLARAVIEQVHDRLRIQGADEAVLATLAESGGRVVSRSPEDRSGYFVRFEDLEGSGLHGLTDETDPALFRELQYFVCDVQVGEPGPADLVVEDGAGGEARDLVEVKVTVTWTSPTGALESYTLWRLFSTYRPGSWRGDV